MNAAPPTIAPARPRHPPRAVDRELGRGRSGQQVARGDRVLELVRRDPAALRSTHSSRSSAMCVGGPPNPMQPMRPHSRDTVRNGGTAAAGPGVSDRSSRVCGAAGWKSSIGLPEGRRAGSACRPGPSMMSLRNVSPAARSRATSASMSSTMRWMRFQPPGPGFAPSGIGRPAELVGSAEQQAQVAARDVGERRRRSSCSTSKPRMLRVEGDRRLDVVDHVADVDQSRRSCVCSPSLGVGCSMRCEQEADARSRARRRCAGTPDSVASSVVARGAGSGMLQWTARGCAGNSGHTSRTRSHRVITQSKRWPANSSRCFERRSADVDAVGRASPAPRWGAAAWGGCRR